MFGQRLRLARKKAGLSMRDLAERVTPGISVQAISKYETGRMMPSSAVLVGLGRALDVSLDFLMGGRVASLEGIEFRKRSGTSAKDRARVEAIVTEYLENYLVIEEILDLRAPDDAFADLVIDDLRAVEDAEEVADRVRHKWDMGLDPVFSMAALLEDRDVKVIEADLPDRFDGLACEVGRDDGSAVHVIMVSSRANIERRRFSLAHELGHRIIRGVADPSIRLEKAVDRFAGAFLVPAASLIAEVGEHRSGITRPEIMQLKHVFGVSAAAMLMRLGQTGILPRSIVEYAFQTWARGWRKAEPEPVEHGCGFGEFERPRRYEHLVWRALGEKLISPVRAAQFLREPLAEIEARIREPA